jgi:Putative metal-binding motif
MGGASRRRWGYAAIFAAACLLWLVAPVAASASYDDLPGEALGPDVPYESVAVFDATTPAFPTQGFSLQNEELAQKSVYTACAEPKGAKDAWVRFSAGVAGNLVVAARKIEPASPIFYIVYTAPSTNPLFSQLHEIGCESAAKSNFESYTFGYPVPAHTVVFVQVLVECHFGTTCEEKEEKEAEGGNTTVRLRFTPANADGDAFPDTLDHCPTVAGAFQGCPDSDGDGVGDADDACPTVKGRAPNGCLLPDEDGDGYPSVAAGGTDCNDANAAIHPGAKDIPGDGIDQNCDGHDAAYPVLHNEIGHVLAYSPKQKRTVGFLSPFKVAGPLVSGMVVRLTCVGRGCPFSRQAVSVHREEHGGLLIGKQLVRQILAPGATVTVSVTLPAYVGEAVRFETRKHGKMRIEELCVPVGTTTPEKQCA